MAVALLAHYEIGNPGQQATPMCILCVLKLNPLLI